MKNAEYLKQLRGKNAAALSDELAALRKEQFNLRLHTVTGQLNKSHLTTGVRKKIARLQTVQNQQAKAS